jgi:hypothetical protein
MSQQQNVAAQPLATMPEQGVDMQEFAVAPLSSTAMILDVANMANIMKFAEFMAKGRSTIPNHLQGNAADCAAVITQAMSWRMNPYAVAQKTHLVNGALGYEAQLVNAVIQSSGVTVGRFEYDWYGPWEKIIGKTKVVKVPAKEGKKEYEFRVPDYGMADEVGLGVRVSAILKGEDEPRVLDLLLVQASVRNSPLWATDPKQQLAYLAVKRWARLYCPDVILGVYTPDELGEVVERDITPGASNTRPVRQSASAIAQRNAERTIDPEEEAKREKLQADMEAVADEGLIALEAAWSRLTKEQRKLHGGLSQALKDRAAQIDAAKGGDYVPE